jgi:hypothetical protein
MINNIYNIKPRPEVGHNKGPKIYEGVYFTYGKMYINHFYEISKFGVNALRLHQYIRTIQGLRYPKEYCPKLELFYRRRDITSRPL